MTHPDYEILAGEEDGDSSLHRAAWCRSMKRRGR